MLKNDVLIEETENTIETLSFEIANLRRRLAETSKGWEEKSLKTEIYAKKRSIKEKEYKLLKHAYLEKLSNLVDELEEISFRKFWIEVGIALIFLFFVHLKMTVLAVLSFCALFIIFRDLIRLNNERNETISYFDKIKMGKISLL